MDERLDSVYGHHFHPGMDGEAEPVVRVNLSLMEAIALYDSAIFLAGKWSHLDPESSGEKTRQRATAKLKAARDDALIECKRRFVRKADTE